MSRLDRVEDWVEQAHAAHYRVAGLARLCHVSESQLRRYFAANFGEAPEHLLAHLRLCRAAQRLLSGPDLELKELAAELYFADASELCHQFKSYFGCPPSQFAQRYRAGDFGPVPPWVRIQRKLARHAKALPGSLPSASAPTAPDTASPSEYPQAKGKRGNPRRGRRRRGTK